MHFYIPPIKDTFITNQQDFLFKNFGIDEILEIGATTQNIITSLEYNIVDVSNYTGSINLINFTGIVNNAYINGTCYSISGSIISP